MATENKTLFGDSLFDPENPVKERDLIFPILFIMAKAQDAGIKNVSTFQLYTVFKDLFVLSQEDMRSEAGRKNITKFRRTLGNVISHGLLDDYIDKKDNRMSLNERGVEFLLDNLIGETREIDKKALKVVENGDRWLQNAVAMQMIIRLAELQRDNKEPVAEKQLHNDIKYSLPLSVKDLAPLKNDRRTKIDKICQNITSSHKVLTRNGWATRSEKGFVLTDKGNSFALKLILSGIPSPDFSFLINKEKEFKDRINQRRAEVLQEANNRRRLKVK